MIPLVNYERELELLRELIERIGETHGLRGADYSIGTMIELPRACLRADEIAHEADFFSFGTNDLTQTALGFSRDDIEAGFLARYIQQRIFDRSPFETLDKPGVGQLVRMGAWLGPEAQERPDDRRLRRTRRRPRLDRLLPPPGSTTSPALRTAYRWRASRPRRPRSAWGRARLPAPLRARRALAGAGRRAPR